MNMKEQEISRLPNELLELATAYQRSKLLFALVEFGLPTLLESRAQSTQEIAQQLHLHPRATDRLLHAGVALGLLQKEGEQFSNALLAKQFLIKGKESYLGDQLLSYDHISYRLWSDLTARLRDWQPQETDNEVPQEEDQGAESLAALHNFALLTGRALGQTYDFSQHQKMLDLGGGTGAMSIGICQQQPHLQATVYDLPPITAAAHKFIAAAKLDARITTQQGNFKEDELPGAFDVVLLANLLSVASEETNRALLRKIYEQLPVGGAVLLSGWILDGHRTSPLIAVLFCLEDINWGAPDVERTAATYERWLREAGYVEINRSMYATPTSLIVGRKRTDDSRAG